MKSFADELARGMDENLSAKNIDLVKEAEFHLDRASKYLKKDIKIILEASLKNEYDIIVKG